MRLLESSQQSAVEDLNRALDSLFAVLSSKGYEVRDMRSLVMGEVEGSLQDFADDREGMDVYDEERDAPARRLALSGAAGEYE